MASPLRSSSSRWRPWPPAAEAATTPGPQTGAIQVQTVTTGTAPAGYTYTIDNGAAVAIGATDTVVVGDQATGDHSVTLAGLDTCTVTNGAAQRTASVTVGDTVPVVFQVNCVPPGGTIRVITQTSDPATDADGYTVSVDGGAAQVLQASDTADISAPAGPHQVTLGDLEGCTTTDNPRTIIVVEGQIAPAAFTVSCGGGGGLGSAPTISNVQAPGTITNSPGDSSGTTYQYADPDGDAAISLRVLVADSSGAYAAYGASGDTLGTAQLSDGRQGTRKLLLGCPDPNTPCPLRPGRVTLRLIVADSAGNSSAPADFTFEIVADTGGGGGTGSAPVITNPAVVSTDGTPRTTITNAPGDTALAAAIRTVTPSGSS